METGQDGIDFLRKEMAKEERLKSEKKLINNPDAKIWAEEFVRIVNTNPSIATDEGTMIGWFANAIMAGYDTANKKKSDEDWDDPNVGYRKLTKEMPLCFINPKDLTKKERDNLDKFDVLIRFQDLGSKGNFWLVPKVIGFKTIKFKNSKRLKGGRLSSHV